MFKLCSRADLLPSWLPANPKRQLSRFREPYVELGFAKGNLAEAEIRAVIVCVLAVCTDIVL